MNVASLELCRELYELSRWADEGMKTWCHDWQNKDHTFESRFYPPAADNMIAPQYDLGYLLRKLPEETTLFSMKKVWNCGLVTLDGADRATADTPEDAAAQLAIELFKQKILTTA